MESNLSLWPLLLSLQCQEGLMMIGVERQLQSRTPPSANPATAPSKPIPAAAWDKTHPSAQQELNYPPGHNLSL